MGRKKEEMEVMPLPQGPVKSRSCTDILCLLLFLVCIVAWAGVSYVGFKNGNPELLMYPTNSTGQICGQSDNAGRPFLFFQDLTVCVSMSSLVNGCPTPQVCVKECPTQTTSLYAYAVAKAGDLPIDQIPGFPDFDLDFQRSLCVPYLTDAEWENAISSQSGKELIALINQKKCPAYTIASIGIAQRCVPDFGLIPDGVENGTIVTDANNQDIQKGDGTKVDFGAVLDSIKAIIDILNLQTIAENILSDVVKTKWMLLAGLGISFAISFLWIFLMRFIAGVMIWLSLGLTIALLALSSAYTWMKYDDLKNVPDAEGSIFDVNPMSQDLAVYLQLRKTWLALFIISVSLCAIVLLITIFLRSRLRIAIALISEASKAVGSIMSSVFFPIFPFLLQLVVVVWWGVVFIYLASSMDKKFTALQIPEGNQCPTDKVEQPCTIGDLSLPDGCECTFTGLGRNALANYLQLYNVFMLFWGLCFCSALGEMVLAGAFSSWYWTLNKSDVPALPVLTSIGRTIRYHTGTLAFGSLIIAIIKMIRLMLQYIQDKLEEKGADNPVVKAILCICKCCFWCLEKFMKFINRNAYILTASQGTNFCRSAKQAFGLIFRNMVRVAVLDKVTDFLLFVGKLVVTAVVALISFYYFSGGINEQTPASMRTPDLNYYFVPVFILALVTYFIAACFFSVYAMAVDTLFLCFLVDSEQNDGSAEKPYYMSPKLMKILSVKNQAKYEK